MSPSAISLVGFAAWTLVLLGALAVHRVTLTLQGRPANSFAPDGSDDTPAGRRLVRAHANCIENLPIFGALVLAALVSGHAGVTDPLAPWALLARVGQSTTHLVSTSVNAVTVRFVFFLVQVLIQAWWVLALGHAWLTG